MSASATASSFLTPHRLMVGGLALLLLGTAFWAYRHVFAAPPAGQGQGMGGMSLPVEGTAARQGTLTQTLEVVGQLQALEGVVLKSEVSGKVAKIHVTDGTRVKAGTRLVTLDDSVQQAALAQAAANLGVSEANVGRYQRLKDIGAASQLQVDNAIAEAKLARANVAVAKANLDKLHISATFDGMAGIVQVTPGEMVTPGQAIVALTNNSTLKVTFSLPESHAATLKVGQEVTILPETATADSIPLTGTIAAVDGRIDPDTRTVAAKVVVKNPDGALLAGQFVRVRVPVQAANDAVVVPVSALVPNGSQIFAYVVNPGPNGMTMSSRTTVTVGLRTADEVQILSGVKPGQVVVTAGQQKLQAPVMPVKVMSPTVVVRSKAVVEPLNATEN